MSIDVIGSVLRCCYSQWYLFQLRQQLYLFLAVHFYLDLFLAITSFSQVSPAITSYYQLSLSIAIPGIPQLSLAKYFQQFQQASSRLPLSPGMSSYLQLYLFVYFSPFKKDCKCKFWLLLRITLCIALNFILFGMI